MENQNAIGLIEVIGLPTAIEAADASLKAANVKLIAIAKADAGILTVELSGDVGAVSSAVIAGAAAAGRVGQVRASHVIPRIEETVLTAGVFKQEKPLFKKKEVAVRSEKTLSDLINPVIDEMVTSNVSPMVDGAEAPDTTNQIMELLSQDHNEEESLLSMEGEEDHKKYSEDELKKMSNSSLRTLIRSLGIKMDEGNLKNMRKQELINQITNNNSKGKGES